MIQIQDVILSDDILDANFCCDLPKCMGACCVEGDSGAPLTESEYEEIKGILPLIWDELSPAAQELIQKQGIAYVDTDGELVTSIIKGKECVFTCFEETGICKCVIDKAFREGRISVQKPVSCHLYPIRESTVNGLPALNYDRWSICSPAIRAANRNGVKLFQFLEEPLVRRFGKEWYDELCQVAAMWNKMKISDR
jgi:hypothetical protein